MYCIAPLVEGEDVQEGGQKGHGDDENGVKVPPPRGLVAGDKVDEEADDLGTGELQDGDDDVEQGRVGVGPPEGRRQRGQDGERASLGPRSLHLLLPATVPDGNDSRTSGIFRKAR